MLDIVYAVIIEDWDNYKDIHDIYADKEDAKKAARELQEYLEDFCVYVQSYIVK